MGGPAPWRQKEFKRHIIIKLYMRKGPILKTSTRKLQVTDNSGEIWTAAELLTHNTTESLEDTLNIPKKKTLFNLDFYTQVNYQPISRTEYRHFFPRQSKSGKYGGRCPWKQCNKPKQRKTHDLGCRGSNARDAQDNGERKVLDCAGLEVNQGLQAGTAWLNSRALKRKDCLVWWRRMWVVWGGALSSMEGDCRASGKLQSTSSTWCIVCSSS